MKIIAPITLMLATAISAPAFAQMMLPDATTLIHNSYVEVEGGGVFQGRTKDKISAVGLGGSSQSASLDSDVFGGALIGYNLTPMISVEAEGLWTREHTSYTSNDPLFGLAGAARTYGGLANAKISIPYTAHFMMFGVSPYIAGGIGYGNVQFTGRNGNFTYQDDNNGFMWQGKAGLEIKTGQHLAFDLAYRYLEAPEYTTPGAFYNASYSGVSKTHVQAATLGVKYNF